MKSLVKRRVNTKQIALVATVLLLVTMLALQLPVNAANTFPHEYELVSINSVDGTGIDRGGNVRGVNDDGSKILFSTAATNIPDATSGYGLYVRDMNSGTTARVDVSQSGTAADKTVSGGVLSRTGRYVAFRSPASNLVDGTVLDSSVGRVYLKDLQTGAIDLIVDIPHSIVGGAGTSSNAVGVSDDGRFITINTNRVNSVLPGTRTGSGGGYFDLVLYDKLQDNWTLINQPIDNLMQNQHTVGGSVSCDASLVVFESAATNFTDDHSGNGNHIFLADIRNGLSVTDITHGATSSSSRPDISCNGRYVTFSTTDRTIINPTPGGMNSYAQLVRYDRINEDLTYVHNDNYQDSYIPSSAADTGDIVLALGPNTSPYSRKVYFKHFSDSSGTLESVQHNSTGLNFEPANSPTFMVSADGKYVVVSSKHSSMLGIPGSQDANGNPIYNIIRIKTGL